MKSPRINETLPDEIYLKILEIGIQSFILSHRDLCSFSLCCKHFNKLCKEDSLWSMLLIIDFPPWFLPSIQPLSSEKALYRLKLDRYVERKLALDRRRISKLDWELELLGRKIKRIRRELKVINVQMGENSGELLNMIKDRYAVCQRKLAKVTKKHTNTEKEVSSAVAKIMNKDGCIPPFCNTNVIAFKYDAEEASSSEGSSKVESEDSSSGISETEYEESSGYESEDVWDRPGNGS